MRQRLCRRRGTACRLGDCCTATARRCGYRLPGGGLASGTASPFRARLLCGCRPSGGAAQPCVRSVTCGPPQWRCRPCSGGRQRGQLSFGSDRPPSTCRCLGLTMLAIVWVEFKSAPSTSGAATVRSAGLQTNVAVGRRSAYNSYALRVTHLQAAWRGHCVRRQLAIQQQAAIAVQAVWQGARQRRAFLITRSAAVQVGVADTCAERQQSRLDSAGQVPLSAVSFGSHTCLTSRYGRNLGCRSRRRRACAALAPCSSGSARRRPLCRQPGGRCWQGAPPALLCRRSILPPRSRRRRGGAAGSTPALSPYARQQSRRVAISGSASC